MKEIPRTVTFVVKMNALLPEQLTEEYRDKLYWAIENALRQDMRIYQILEMRILEEDQAVQVVPAAAGKTLEEVIEAEEFVYLARTQRERVARILNHFLAPLTVRVPDARLCQTTSTLIALIVFHDGKERLYTQTLLPTTVDFILGEGEKWDPTER